MSDLRDFAGDLGRLGAQLTPALREGIKHGLVAVENAAGDLLNGSGEPGSYPIPIRAHKVWAKGKGLRTVQGGTLRRGLGHRLLSDSSGMVFNRAKHARPNHEGFRPYGNPHAAKIKPRPFLTDAVDVAKPEQYVFRSLDRTIRRVLG